jgi:hypothetical protein
MRTFRWSSNDEANEEDYTADGVVEALNDALDAGDFPTAAETAAFDTIVTPHVDICLPQPSGSLKPPSAAPSRANSPSVSAEPVFIKPVATSSQAVGGLDEVADSLRAALALDVRGSAVYSSLVTALDLHLLSIARKGKASASVLRDEEHVAKALRRRLVSSSDDDDEMNDTPAEAAKRDLIRRRKNLRLIEKKKLDSEAKDSL